MRVRGWRIHRFGCFQDYEVADLPDGITIVYGANEAGKSTLHAFLRGVLFGFPTARSSERRLTHDGSPVGHIDLEIDGERLVVERKNASKQPVIVRRSDGSVGDEHVLHTLLGNADSKLFRAVFAFSLRELQDFGSLNADQVRDRMFSATLGAGRTTPAAASDELSERAKILYRDRGITKGQSRLAVTLEQITHTDQQIRAARIAAREFPTIDLDLQRLALELERLRKHERFLLDDKRTRASLIDLAPQRDECVELRLRLASLPSAPSISEEAERRFDDLREALSREEDTVRELDDERANAMARVAQLVTDEELLGVTPELDRVMEELALQRDRLARVDAARFDSAFARQALEAQLERLGTEWTAQRLRLWQRSLARRQECQEWQIHLDRAATTLDELAKSISSARLGLEEQDTQSARLRAELPDPAPPLRDELERRDAALHRLRGARETERERQQELREAEGQLADVERRVVTGTDSARPLLFGTAAAVALGAALAYLGYMLPGVLILGVAVVLVLVALQRKPAALSNPEVKLLRERRDQAAAGLELARAELARAAASLDMHTSPSAEELSVLGTSITRAREARVSYDARLQQLKTSDAVASRYRERLAALEAERDTAVRTLEQRKSDWEELRTSFGITAALTPVGTLSFMDALDAAREQLDRLDALEKTVQREAEAVTTWSSVASGALATAGIVVGDDHAALLASVAALATRVNKERELRGQRDGVVQQLAGVDARLAVATQRRDAVVAALTDLLTECECTDEAAFRRSVAASRDRRALETQLRSTEDRIGAVLRTLPDAPFAQQELERGSVSEWGARLRDIEEALAACSTEREVCIERRAELLRRRQETSVADDIATLDLQRSSLVAQAEVTAREWLALTLANSLIRRTRELYERERQPAVLDQATPLFRTVTGGRYERILQREDGSGFDLLTSAGRRWRESELSQGTQEQLYLCLRIALAQEFSRDRTMLPLIMDDVLVNFDPDRADAMARVLAEVGQARQVLFFTCHPHTEAMMRRHAADVRVVTLPKER